MLYVLIFLKLTLIKFSVTNKKISTSRGEIIFLKFFQDILKQTQFRSKTSLVLILKNYKDI